MHQRCFRRRPFTDTISVGVPMFGPVTRPNPISGIREPRSGPDHPMLDGGYAVQASKRYCRVRARSKRSAFITVVHAATKSFTNFSFESTHA
jgi:hypothetical protein